MIGFLFIAIFTLLCALAGWVTAKYVKSHLKVYMVLVLNCLFLCGIFGIYRLLQN